MHKFTASLVLVLALCLGAVAQQDPYAQPPQQDQKQSKDQEKEKTDKKEKKDTKKKDKTKPEDVYDTAVFSQAVANSVLNDLRDGLEGHSQRLALSAFDQDKMDGYLTFEDQIEAMMQRYEAFRVHYRITQSTVEGARGVVLVDWQMEEIPRSGGAPIRRNGQIKFEMERGRKGWKIVDFNPRGFFS